MYVYMVYDSMVYTHIYLSIIIYIYIYIYQLPTYYALSVPEFPGSRQSSVHTRHGRYFFFKHFKENFIYIYTVKSGHLIYFTCSIGTPQIQMKSVRVTWSKILSLPHCRLPLLMALNLSAFSADLLTL